MHQELGQTDFGRGYATQPSSRTMSPVQQARSHTVDDHTRQHNSRASQANAIAPSFQIPRSVNDSGGSLSELAAQVRFWPCLQLTVNAELTTDLDHLSFLV